MDELASLGVAINFGALPAETKVVDYEDDTSQELNPFPPGTTQLVIECLTVAMYHCVNVMAAQPLPPNLTIIASPDAAARLVKPGASL